jgi:predicted Zn-dependent peptidase
MTDVRPVALDVERHELGNGLRVVLHRDRSLPLVALNVWYHVGSRNESPGRTGFAHLFEHLLFQGSEHVGTNDHFRYVQQAGGTANGSTWYDRTTYHAVLPAHQLDLALWLESDRMGFFLPSITQEKLDNQREVVLNERRQRIENQPYGLAFERLHELLYAPGHPYRWPVIGYPDDLEAAGLDDVRAFFRRFYVPDNAVLTLAGDFGDDVTERIERYFGDVPAGAGAEPEPEPPPPRAGERRDALPDRVELARVYVAFQMPPFGTREWYAADLLATVLADGKSSLLYEDLVYHRQLAQDVGCFVLPTEIAATFAVTATAAAGGDPLELEEALCEHLAAVAASPPAARHLERARQRLLTVHFHQLQTLERRADLLSHFTTFFDAPERVGEEVRTYQELAADDLAALVAAHCPPDRRTVLTVVPERGEDGAAPAEPVAATGEEPA